MWSERKAKTPGESPGFLRIERVARSVPPAADLVVHAGAEDVVIELDAARRDVQASAAEGRLRERGVVVELDIEIFALDRPAVTERVLPADAHRPTGAGIALLMAGASLIADEKFGRVDLCPRSAAGRVDHRLVPPGPAELAARSDEPTLLGLRNPVGPVRGDERHEAGLEVLALFVGRHAVAFEAKDPLADLIVAAALEAADEAGEVEVASNAGSSRSGEQYGCGSPQRASGLEGVPDRGLCAPSGRIPRVCTGVAAGPSVDRNRRRRWCICRHRPFGSECRRHPQAQRKQRYASEK